MKNIKYILVPVLFILFAENQSAYGSPISGYGCSTGQRVYINKMGTSSWYGVSFDVYNSNGQYYPIDANNGSQCNIVNANQVQDQGNACWINSYVNPANNMTGVTYGKVVYYTLNTCPSGVPLDDYIWVFVAIIGSVGAYMLIRKRIIA